MNSERIDCSRPAPYWQGAAPFPRPVTHPVFYSAGEIERARDRARRCDWAKRYLDGLVRRVEDSKILEMPDSAIRGEIFDTVGFPLPRCPVDRGKRSWRVHYWDWDPADPLHVRCRTCGSVLPGTEHVPTGELEVTCPSGQSVRYRYWQDKEGFRYHFDSMVANFRQEQVTGLARPLALVHALTGDRGFARKAAVILARLAEVYPHYPVHGLGVAFHNADTRGFYENRFYRDPPFPFVSSRWGNYHDSPFVDAGRAFQMGQAYDLIRGSGALEELSTEAGTDLRAAIERDLLYEAARHTLETPYRATNYDGSRITGLGLLGRMLNEPGFVRHAVELYRVLIDNGFWYDGFWHEDTLGYFAMIVGGVLRVPEVLSGPGGTDILREIPSLPRIYTAPLGLHYPDGRTVPVNDTWSRTTYTRAGDLRNMDRFVEAADEMVGRSRIPAADPEFALFRRTFRMDLGPEEMVDPGGPEFALFRRGSEADRMCSQADLLPLVPENCLLPGSGEVMLGVGRSTEALRAHVTFGPWGGHHHRDTLALNLYAHCQELLSDIGYTHTFLRPWATSAASHNTVVVDGREPSEAGGRLLGYRPASVNRSGLVCVEAPAAYPGIQTFRRTVLLVPTGEDTGFVVDVFDVAGGSTHDYWLHGAADYDQQVRAGLPLKPAEIGLRAPDPAAQMARYESLRNVAGANLRGDARVRIGGQGLEVSLWICGSDGGRLLVGEGPSVRRAQERDAETDRYWFPAICCRREGGRSRFVSLIEAGPAGTAFRTVERIPCEADGVLLRVSGADGGWTVGVDPAGAGFSCRLPDGRPFELRGRAGVAREGDGNLSLDLIDGSRLRVGDAIREQTPAYWGTLTGIAGDITGQPERAEFLTDADLPSDGSLDGRIVYVTHPGGSETCYQIAQVDREGRGESRIRLADMPRFLWGRGRISSGGPGRFESDLEHPKASAYPGARLRLGERVFTIREMTRLTGFSTAEEFDFGTAVGRDFEVFSTAVGDRLRIAR